MWLRLPNLLSRSNIVSPRMSYIVSMERQVHQLNNSSPRLSSCLRHSNWLSWSAKKVGAAILKNRRLFQKPTSKSAWIWFSILICSSISTSRTPLRLWPSLRSKKEVILLKSPLISMIHSQHNWTKTTWRVNLSTWCSGPQRNPVRNIGHQRFKNLLLKWTRMNTQVSRGQKMRHCWASLKRYLSTTVRSIIRWSTTNYSRKMKWNCSSMTSSWKREKMTYTCTGKWRMEISAIWNRTLLILIRS